MINLLRQLARDRRGAAAIEFAFVAPPMIMLIVGTMEVGLALHRGATVQWVLEKAARRAMVDQQITEGEIQHLVDEMLAELGEPSEVVVSYDLDSSGGLPVAHLTADYDHELQVPLISAFSVRFSVSSYIPQPAA